MKVYDTLNKLIEEIKTSEEFIGYKKMQEMAEEKVELKEKLKEFENVRYQVQVSTLRGEEPEKEQLEKMQKTYLELIQIENAKQYLEAELKFNTMLSQINSSLAEVVKEVM